MGDKQNRCSENLLLAQLPEEELAALRPERVSLALGQSLIAPHEPITNVYFPISSLGSLVTLLEDGASVESGAVGREGMVGIPVILNATSTPMQTLVQVAGEAYRVSSEVVTAEFQKRRMLFTVLNRYVHTCFVVASQSAACNRKHSVEARLARWLLMSADGIGADGVAITQEFLSTMLGVRRPGVTTSAIRLQQEGLIAYTRGFVQILDRQRLEQTACECYAVVKDEYARLIH